jgi:hypothetical protein
LNEWTAFGGLFVCGDALSIACRCGLRLDIGRSVEGCIMRSSGPQWVALVLAVLALAIITYIAMPPGLIKQATALWGGG